MSYIVGVDPSFTACGVSDGLERHIIIPTKPRDEESAVKNLTRRALEICDGIIDFIGTGRADVQIFVEAPMLAAHGNGAHHLFEMGWLMNDLYSRIPNEIKCGHFNVHEVPTSTLRKWAVGKGSMKKDEMKLAVFKKFGVEFDRDPGCDKLFAFLLARYGKAVLAGEITHQASARRGAGRRAQQVARGNALKA